MHHIKLVDAPVEKEPQCTLDQCPKIELKKEQMSKVSYVSTVRSLIYAMMYTCLDIYFNVGLVNHYQSNPGLAH